jgi:hypothetical protein
MVAHSSRFNALAVFCSLAALSLSPLSASALAIQARDSTSSSKHVLARSPGRQETFILSLPYHATKQSASKKNKDKSASSTKGKLVSVLSLEINLAADQSRLLVFPAVTTRMETSLTPNGGRLTFFLERTPKLMLS